MNIIFENQNFVVIDKDAGWLTTPARFAEKDPRPVLGLEIQKKWQRQVFPVHRLDFEVSGIVVFALSALAHQQANGLFENKKVQKTYQALTENRNRELPKDHQVFEWKSKILRGKKRAFESPHGKPSLTMARFLELDPSSQSLKWELNPITGRSHQLRFDLSRHGYPIVGDVLYGATPTEEKNIVSLRAVGLKWLDPEFCAQWQLPQEFRIPGLF